MSTPRPIHAAIQEISALPPPKPSGAFRILHFSDIHLGLMPRISQVFNKRFLGAVNHLFRRRHKLHPEYIGRLQQMLPALAPDLTVFSGDLSSVATPEELQHAAEILRPFAEASDFILVPGNHDAYVPDALPHLEHIGRELNSGRWAPGDLPVAYETHGLRFCLINAALPLSPLLSCGILSQEDQQRIDSLFSPGEMAIAICHFPAFSRNGGDTGWRHGLRGEKYLQAKLRDKTFSLILSGHEHTPYIYRLENGALQVCAGSLTLKGSYAVLDVARA